MFSGVALDAQQMGVFMGSSRLTPLANCHITIELAGPGQPSSITLSRKGVVQAIKWVLEACVLRGHGLGGFVTMGTYYMMQYVSENPAAILTRSSRKQFWFYVVLLYYLTNA